MSCVILCYHKVGSVQEEGRFLNVEPRDLEAQVRFLRRGGPVGRLQDFARGESMRAVLTFDDAYQSAVNHGAEVLNRHKTSATFFVVTRRLSSDWDGDRARPLATLDELKDLSAAGHEIGNHTQSHPRLADSIDPGAEIAGADADLRYWGFAPESFCYPYGSLDDRSIEAVRSVGYRSAVSLQRGVADQKKSPYTLPRIVIGYSDRLAGLIYKLYIRPRLP